MQKKKGVVPFDRLKKKERENLRPLREGDYLLEQSETRKSSKDCYISFEGNRYSLACASQYSCRDLMVKLKGDDLKIFYGDQLIATHRLSYQKGQMITDPAHFPGIPEPAYPTGIRAIRKETPVSRCFLLTEAQARANPFIDGLVSSRYGNARYHMLERVLY